MRTNAANRRSDADSGSVLPNMLIEQVQNWDGKNHVSAENLRHIE